MREALGSSDAIRAALPALAAWLDYRVARWPNTANPRMFVNIRISRRATPVSGYYITETLGTTVRAPRADRIVHEALVTGGDVRRLCDMFGLSIPAANATPR